ncbi:MAG: cytochrome P450 [Devosiaceae bacterium]|nr:cytochrome P450 [Devosiaceae bacterium MH13]
MPFYQPQPVIEEAGEARFEPAHPKPSVAEPSLLKLILGARHSLIGEWRDTHYLPCVDDFQILGRRVVLVNEPEAIKHVLATHNDRYERKAPQMRRALEALLGDGLFISDGQTWQQRRPLVADIVHKNRLQEFAPIMETVLRETVEAQAKRPDGSKVDGLPFMAELTAEIIARTVFGAKLGQEAASEVVSGFSQFQRAIDSFNLGYFIGANEGWAVRRTRRLQQAIGRVHEPIEHVVQRHLDGQGEGQSMVALLVKRQAKNPDLDLDVTAIRNEAATIFMAGHETTALTLAWAWYCLSKAPWCEAALHEELDRILGDRQPTLADLPKLPYARAVIEETLRLYPPVPILSRQASRDDELGGVKVDKSSLVLVIPWLLHRTETFWDDPHSFDPTRFVGDHRPAPYTYIPFAAGPRICAGLAFGLAEAVLSLASLAQRFRFVVPEDYVADPRCRLTLRPHAGMPLRIFQR